jgi:hypothetical protein
VSRRDREHLICVAGMAAIAAFGVLCIYWVTGGTP